MTATVRIPLGRVHQINSSGAPLAGCKLYVYQNNTTTPVSLFSDAAGLVTAANPIVADSAGRFPVRYSTYTSALTLLLTDSAGSPIWSDNDIVSDAPVSSALSPVVNAGSLQEGRRALNAQPWVNILDYVTDATVRNAILGFTQTADVSSYLQAAGDAADDVGATVYCPPGRYPILSTVTSANITIQGDQFVEDLYPYGTKGTVFVFTSTANTPFKFGASVSFDRIVFWWPNQIDDRATWVANSGPIVYPTLIENATTSTVMSGFSFTNCVVLNAYDFMDVGGDTVFDKGGRWTFANNRICALRRTFNLDNVPDVIECSGNIWGWNVYADEMMHFGGAGAGATTSITSITRASTTATATTNAAHGYATGKKVTIAGASQTEYNGEVIVTVTGATTFTYTVSGSPATPATGTITATAYYLRDYATDNMVFARIHGDAAIAARATYSCDGLIMGGLYWGFRRVIDIDGGALNVLKTNGAIFDACSQILHTRNYGTIAADEIDVTAAFCYKFNYTATATPAAILIDTPAPIGGVPGTTIRVKGSMGFCTGTFLQATGDYVKSIDLDCNVDAFGHLTTDAGTYYAANITCANALVSVRGLYAASGASSGGVNRTGITMVDSAMCSFVGAQFNYCNRPINITDTAGAYIVQGCSSLNTGDTASLNYATGNIAALANYFDKPAANAVTQMTNRSTAVELNKLNGAITTDSTSLAAEASAAFTVTNSCVALGDVVIVSIRSGANGGNTAVTVTTVAAGSFQVKVSNNNAAAGTAETGAIVINFQVVKVG